MLVFILLGCFIIVSIFLYIIYLLNRQNKQKSSFIKSLRSNLGSICAKHGMTFETMVPMSENFEKFVGPRENATFLGKPIDYIYFDEEKIIFVEVKTGNSRLSNRQEKIKKLIKNKSINWIELYDDGSYYIMFPEENKCEYVSQDTENSNSSPNTSLIEQKDV